MPTWSWSGRECSSRARRAERSCSRSPRTSSTRRSLSTANRRGARRGGARPRHRAPDQRPARADLCGTGRQASAARRGARVARPARAGRRPQLRERARRDRGRRDAHARERGGAACPRASTRSARHRPSSSWLRCAALPDPAAQAVVRGWFAPAPVAFLAVDADALWLDGALEAATELAQHVDAARSAPPAQ